MPSSPLHTSVLKYEPIDALLSITKKDHRVFVDATLGLGGHSLEILSHLGPTDRLIGIDRDKENLSRAEEILSSSPNAQSSILRHANFSELEKILQETGISQIDGILYDLGVSSVHYDESERWFSLRFDGPLDMRFDRASNVPTVAEYLKKVDERTLFQVLRDYGDEPKAYFIAKAIIEARKTQAIETTFALKSIIQKSSFDPKSPIRVFQALRIEINSELDHVVDSLHQAVRSLSIGGRIAVITFHSIEDRLVKNLFKEYEAPLTDPFTGRITAEAVLKKITKKPLEPSEEEVRNNPRARSAKLRILEKTNSHER